MIVQPCRDPFSNSAIKHVCDADERRREPWVTDRAIYLDAGGNVRLDFTLATSRPVIPAVGMPDAEARALLRFAEEAG